MKISEATISNGYPDDGSGIAGDDDTPTGNIVYGEKYKKVPFFNRLTSFQQKWDVDSGPWKWDEFPNSGGMEANVNYHRTIKNMEILTKSFKRMKDVPLDDIQSGYDHSLYRHKDVKNSLGLDNPWWENDVKANEDSVDVVDRIGRLVE